MPSALPYVPNYGKIKGLFEKIASAKVPDAFTQAYLADTLGLKSGGDRPLIPLLKSLEFIDAASKPTAHYSTLKNPSKASITIAEGTRRAFAPLFAANEQAHKLPSDQLKGLIAQVAGSDEEVTRRTAGTFRTLIEVAGAGAFESSLSPDSYDADDSMRAQDRSNSSPPIKDAVREEIKHGLRPEFHYNIQIHLPSNANEETYLSIFNALRKSLS